MSPPGRVASRLRPDVLAARAALVGRQAVTAARALRRRLYGGGGRDR